MDENLKRILSESNRLIGKIQLLAAFFGHDIVYKIFLRTQVIHKLFESTPDLDINKLELFHLQFTTTIIDLLKKIKRSNERNVALLYDEMALNRDLMDKLGHAAHSGAALAAASASQTRKLGISLRKLYQVLSDGSEDYPFSNNIHAFSSRFAQDYFDDVPADAIHQAIAYDPAKVYRNSHAVIQRKLLGLLAKNDFSIEFFDGVKAGSLSVEIYALAGTGKYFLFVPSKNLFLLCEPAGLNDPARAGLAFKKEGIVQDLERKNAALASRADAIKAELPADILQLLNDYYYKIGDAGFLQNIANFDVQANILRAMLNTDTL